MEENRAAGTGTHAQPEPVGSGTSAVVGLEGALHGFSAFVVMPLFAFSNAGVRLGGGRFVMPPCPPPDLDLAREPRRREQVPLLLLWRGRAPVPLPVAVEVLAGPLRGHGFDGRLQELWISPAFELELPALGECLGIGAQDGDTFALNRVALGTQVVSVWKDATELGTAAGKAALELCKNPEAAAEVTRTTMTTKGADRLPIQLAPRRRDLR